MIKYFGYIYLTVDTLKNQVYIGKRQKSEYDSNYFGSGTIIKNIIKKRKESLRNYVLEWCSTKEELYQAERDWIKNFREECDKKCLNIADGGEGGRRPGFHLSDECKKHLSEVVKDYYKNPENRKKTSQATKEAMNRPEVRENFLKGTAKKDMFGDKNPVYGKKLMSRGYNEQIFVLPENIEKYKLQGFVLGACQSYKDKFKGKKWDENMHDKLNKTRQNRIWIHNDKEEKWIYKTEIELYLSKNYVLGRRNNN